MFMGDGVDFSGMGDVARPDANVDGSANTTMDVGVNASVGVDVDANAGSTDAVEDEGEFRHEVYARDPQPQPQPQPQSQTQGHGQGYRDMKLPALPHEPHRSEGETAQAQRAHSPARTVGTMGTMPDIDDMLHQRTSSLGAPINISANASPDKRTNDANALSQFQPDRDTSSTTNFSLSEFPIPSSTVHHPFGVEIPAQVPGSSSGLDGSGGGGQEQFRPHSAYTSAPSVSVTSLPLNIPPMPTGAAPARPARQAAPPFLPDALQNQNQSQGGGSRGGSSSTVNLSGGGMLDPMPPLRILKKKSATGSGSAPGSGRSSVEPERERERGLPPRYAEGETLTREDFVSS